MDSIILRDAGPNEKRCILRHDLGFYSSIVVGAIYTIPQELAEPNQVEQADLYLSALSECVQQHPLLSTTIQNAHSSRPAYSRPQRLEIFNHLRLIQTRGHEHQSGPDLDEEPRSLVHVLENLHNDSSSTYASEVIALRPAWMLHILPLSKRSSDHRVFVIFSYSHSHGDGMSGIAFHRTFHDALQRSLQLENTTTKSSFEPSPLPLLEQPDTSSTMPISLSYLLRPALGTYLPSFLTKLFGLTGTVSGADDHTWTGSKKFIDKKTPSLKATSKTELCTIETETLSKVLVLCKKNNVKLTSLLDQVIAQALSKALLATNVDTSKYTNFISLIPINLRRALGVSENTIGNYGGSAYLRYNLEEADVPFTDQVWELLRTHGQHLANAASTTRDLPIGLLRFVANFHSWLKGQIGEPRDSSWELSNLGSFDPRPHVIDSTNAEDARSVRIEQMFFSQPASPIGIPLSFNAVAVRGGPLNLLVTWQPGALDPSRDDKTAQISVEEAEREQELVRQVMYDVGRRLRDLAQSSS